MKTPIQLTPVRQKSNPKVNIICSVLLIVGLIVSIYSGFKLLTPSATLEKASYSTQYEAILTDSELAAWNEKTAKSNKAFVQLNTEINVTAEGIATDARIINPPYSGFEIKVKLTLKDGTLLFESPTLPRGNTLNEIQLIQPLPSGDYTAIMQYEFYTQDGVQKDEYAVNVMLKV